MGSGGRGVDWRDEAAAALLVRHLPGLGLKGPVLVMGELRSEVLESLSAMGFEVAEWHRRAFGVRRATPWPPEGPFGAVVLRMPRAKEELEMGLHGAAGALVSGGTCLVYGAKDEGIASAPKRLERLFGGVVTVGVGGHCRVLKALRRDDLPGHRGTLDAWRQVGRLDYGGAGRDWVSYPGVFAHGHLDPGTRLLLDALPALPAGGRVLDYGCGSGVVGSVLADRYPQVRLDLLDVDAVALEAARENVPGARLLQGDGLPPGDGDAFDAIVSNPPFHRGKAEEPEMITRLVQEAPAILGPRGVLVLVAQRRIRLEEAFGRAFRRVQVTAEGGGFRVWEGRDPSWRSPR
jgi:16S rRNA (guanine1207-N2)-methyltransferase